jgi:hypothetical protein
MYDWIDEGLSMLRPLATIALYFAFRIGFARVATSGPLARSCRICQ